MEPSISVGAEANDDNQDDNEKNDDEDHDIHHRDIYSTLQVNEST
jgi:hypothetical protein